MKRLESWGLVAIWVMVAVLIGSLVVGLRAEGGGDGEEEAAAAALEDAPAGRVRVEVLNAAGTPGLARAATRVLRERQFDVVYFGNASRFNRDSSMVIDRGSASKNAQRIAELLGIPRVRVQADTTLYLDVTVVLGRDWRVPEGARLLPPAPDAVDEP